MALLCEDCGEEPQQPGKAICKWCADYNEQKAAEARAYQRYELSLLDRDLDGAGAKIRNTETHHRKFLHVSRRPLEASSPGWSLMQPFCVSARPPPPPRTGPLNDLSQAVNRWPRLRLSASFTSAFRC